MWFTSVPPQRSARLTATRRPSASIPPAQNQPVSSRANSSCASASSSLASGPDLWNSAS